MLPINYIMMDLKFEEVPFAALMIAIAVVCLAAGAIFGKKFWK